MKKATLILIIVAMIGVMIIGIAVSVSAPKVPKGEYICNDEFFGYTIRFDGKNVFAGSSSKGKATFNGENVSITYTDGTTDYFIYNAEFDYLTDTSGTLKWEKK